MPSFSGGGPLLTDNGLDLLNQMLTYDPERRISAADALVHPYFHEDPPPKPTSMMPTFPSLAEKPALATQAHRPHQPADNDG